MRHQDGDSKSIIYRGMACSHHPHFPKPTYPMTFTRVTKRQLHTLAVVLDSVMLPKLGVNRKIKQAVVYGRLELGGMEYPYIGTIQD